MRDQVAVKRSAESKEKRRESLKQDKDVRDIIDKMSDTRRAWTRPRTRVYDCNYNLGEQYYKPVVDSLDRKYGGGIADRLGADEPFSRRSPFESRQPVRVSEPPSLEDDDLDVTASLQRLKASRAARQELEDELESLSTERMLKKKAASTAAARESLMEEELESALTSGARGRARRHNYADQLLDTVGVNGKLHEKLLVDEVNTFRRKAQSAIDDFNEEVPRLTKWTALNANSMTESLEESAAESAAKARARKSKARLADLDAEMEALTERGQQREMRVKGLRSLLAESASSAVESSSTHISQSQTTSSSVQVADRKRERKVNF